MVVYDSGVEKSRVGVEPSAQRNGDPAMVVHILIQDKGPVATAMGPVIELSSHKQRVF
jgi:hypothetical protein